MSISPKTQEAYQLMHDSILTLSKVEANGMRIDVDFCKKQQQHLGRKIKRLETLLYADPTIKEWKNIYRGKFSIDSGPQLADMLYNKLGLTPTALTDKGNPAVNKEALESLDVPFVKNMLQMRKLKKAKDTYIANILRETVDGYLHPSFSLHTVRTFRGSSQNLNFQNIPIRDPEVKRAIRRAFLPRKGHLFGGIDFGSMEVRIAATYHKDPNMLRYIKDPTTDMHRDVTMDCFKIDDPALVHPDARQLSKGAFTFAQLYGDYYISCAKNLYEGMMSKNLTLNDAQGTLLIDHLATHGIVSYDDFVEHIKHVEDIFWNERFAVYTKWKKDWKSAYDRKGYFDMHTGFRCSGYMQKNNVLNYQIQGAAFHCLLWSLIKLQAWLTKYNFRSKIIGQIHDEIVVDMHESEIEVILAKCKQIMTVDLPNAWTWINVPLEVDADFSPPDESWYSKTGLPIPDDDFRTMWKKHTKGYTSSAYTYDCPTCKKVKLLTTPIANDTSIPCKCGDVYSYKCLRTN